MPRKISEADAVQKELLQPLLHKLMSGETRIGDLDLSALSAQPALQGVSA